MVDEVVRIVGGRTLAGAVAIAGAKNAGLPLLAASLLTDEEVVLHRVPELRDIGFMGDILQKLQGEFVHSGGTVRVRMENPRGNPDYDAVRLMRASVCVMGPLVARRGEVQIPLPGGCVLGARPIDLHLRGLERLGCSISLRNGLVHVAARRLRGANIFLGGRHGSTVTGTANVLCAAVLAEGITQIQSAACEPEVVDLCHLLCKMGARIDGIGSPTLTIEGVGRLHGAEHTLIPDRIEFGTFLLIALITHSDLVLPAIESVAHGALLDILAQAGASIEVGPERTFIRGSACELRPVELTTLPFPGFPTDLQAPMCALMTQAAGISVLTERVYPSRFSHVAELERMGGHILLEGPSAIVRGPTKLSGAPVTATELRGGACLYMAALAAEGESVIRGVEHVDRGYENFDAKLRSIGAVVERECLGQRLAP
ncbi:MAG: UDP-N-acetylglucosamine 1-carboxyvinyltransferase [Puniceicoccales bacterium]|jgi:UDP-N-acetylglucosamine 1-carboxyvinyltransferase|nr:UDP-N-acetylglucosamine 1-carboxyvinyltransferase [Puniceicoccales bacterium]